MGDQPGSFPRCAQVRTKVHKKAYDWSVGLVYDPRELPGVPGLGLTDGDIGLGRGGL
jgi:hypothetical protein